MAEIPGINVQKSIISFAPNPNEMNNNSIVCIFELPFRIPLNNSYFEFEMDGDQFEIGLQKVDQKMVMTRNILTIDRYGQSSTTNVNVKIKGREINCEQVYKAPNLTFEKGIKAINRLLDACSLYCTIYCPRKLLKVDILTVSLKCKGNFKSYTNPFAEENNTAFEVLQPSHQNRSQIKQFLKSNNEIPLDESLIVNSEDYYLSENYRIAVIEIQSAVEYAISQLIMRYHSKLGTSTSQINEILNMRLDDLKKELNIVVPNLTGQTVWADWRSKCYEIRNSIVHKGYTPSKSESREAIDKGRKMIELLNSK